MYDPRNIPKRLTRITLRPALRLSDARVIQKALAFAATHGIDDLIDTNQEGLEDREQVRAAIARVRTRLDITESEARARQTAARETFNRALGRMED
jgi:hypothetical protein